MRDLVQHFPSLSTHQHVKPLSSSPQSATPHTRSICIVTPWAAAKPCCQPRSGPRRSVACCCWLAAGRRAAANTGHQTPGPAGACMGGLGVRQEHSTQCMPLKGVLMQAWVHQVRGSRGIDVMPMCHSAKLRISHMTPPSRGWKCGPSAPHTTTTSPGIGS